MQLDQSQEAAVEIMLSAHIACVTGGPGCGKTTTLKVALDRLDAMGMTYVLCAPSGKAAKRMNEATFRSASTIHRALGWTPNGWTFNRANPIDADVVFVDESSMVDIELAAHLMDAARNSRVIFIGDGDQLPPVGPGRVFADLVENNAVPIARLTTVHRSAAESWVCVNAPKVLAGVGLDLAPRKDFKLVECESQEEAAHAVALLVASEEYAGAQVLAPQRNTECGVEALNTRLQARLNPPRASEDEWKLGDKVLRCCDRVIQTVNNYKIVATDGSQGVFNGEVGDIVSMGERLVVDFGDRRVTYSKGDAATGLDLAYALSVHKCVAPDTIVETAQGLLPIRDIAGMGNIATADGPLPYDRFVRNPKAKALRIVSEGGYEITVTPDHKMMAWTGTGYELVEAQNVSVGQFLRLRMGATIEPASPAYLPILERGDSRAHVHKVPRIVDDDVAEFLGLMVADGTVYARGFRLVKRHADVALRFARLCRALFGVVPKILTRPNDYVVEVNSTQLSRWLISVGGLVPNKKAVPPCILRSSSSLHAVFLRGLFEDGTVNLKGKAVDHVEWSTCMPEMARIVQVMLLRLGVISNRTIRRNQSMVYIYGQNAIRFRERIGFVSAWKNVRLYSSQVGNETRYLVPVDRSQVSRETHAGRNARHRGYVSRHAAAECLPQADAALSFHHVRIERIEEVESESMCVRVPRLGRFLQNGFDGSNSQGSEFAWVIFVCHSAHSFMLSRPLFYTAITRAKKGVVLVGNLKGISVACSAKEPPKRQTGLIDRMREYELAAAVARGEGDGAGVDEKGEQLSW